MTPEREQVRQDSLESLSRDELVQLVEEYRALARDRAQRLSSQVVNATTSTRPVGEAEAILNRRVVKFALAAARPFEPTYQKVKPALSAMKAKVRRAPRGTA